MPPSSTPRSTLPSDKPAPASDKIDRRFLRKLLRAYCSNDSDLDAFCVDRFGHIFKQYSSGMNRTQKENLLLINITPQRLLNAIRAYVKDNLPDRFFDELERSIANEFTNVSVAQHEIAPTAILNIAEANFHRKPKTGRRSSRTTIVLSCFVSLAVFSVLLVVMFATK